MIDWTHVIGVHAPQMMVLGIIVLVGQLVHQVLSSNHFDLQDFSDEPWNYTLRVLHDVQELLVRVYHQLYTHNTMTLSLLAPYVQITVLLLLLGAWRMRRESPVYLMGFATWKAPDSWKLTHDQIMSLMQQQECFTEESLAFMRRILERSGTGPATAWPPSITYCAEQKGAKVNQRLETRREEARVIVLEVVQDALEKAKVKPHEIDVLIINCSLFSPTPSLCAMVINHFGMRSNVATYNLSGMGCSAGLISVDLAKQVLGNQNNGYKKALVVSTEILSGNFYFGNDRAFLIQNTLFRCGGAALVLSNQWSDGRRAWYKLLHTVRVQGTGDASYECVYEGEDSNSNQGVRLSKDIVKVAGKCMEKNFTRLGPQVLPWSEQAMVVGSIIVRYIQKRMGEMSPMKPYVPDFKTAFDHFCIHAGGRGVIDGIEKNMQLETYHTEPSRMALYRYGNTSSSSIWYELEYIQEHQKTNPLRKGDRILQVAFGSGFKCTSGVWVKL